MPGKLGVIDVAILPGCFVVAGRGGWWSSRKPGVIPNRISWEAEPSGGCPLAAAKRELGTDRGDRHNLGFRILLDAIIFSSGDILSAGG